MTTYINASCHCGLNSFRVAFETDSLPIQDNICHCSTCKHASGQLAIHYVSIVGGPLKLVHELGSRSASRNTFREEHNHRGFGNGQEQGHRDKSTLWAPTPHISVAVPEIPLDLGDLVEYQAHSPNIIRYFCRSCSAHLFWVRRISAEELSWSVAVGALERTEGIVKPAYHIWVQDTLDGGLADHLRAIDDVPLIRFKEGPGSEELPSGWNTVPSREPHTSKDLLKAYCQCGAIQFAITRPSEPSFNPSVPYPDLLYSHRTTHLAKLTNMKDEKWWLRPANSMLPTKYLAGHCMCNSCRLTTGFEVQSWAFVPLVNIVTPHTLEPISLDMEGRRPTGLTQYLTSPGKYREFCGTCGATVFSWGADFPDLVSVSAGLFDEKKVGARAEGWLDWHKNRVAYQEKALSRAVANGLEQTLKGLATCPTRIESEKRRVELYEEPVLTESPSAGMVVV